MEDNMKNNILPNDKEGKEEKTSLDKAKTNLKEALDWLFTLVIVIIVSFLITNFIILKAEVPTGSMKNTINIKDRVIGWRLISKVERGDIVIFPALKYAEEDALYVKRVIGLPGETVEIKDGKVYINGELLKEDYLPEEMVYSKGEYHVPEGCYFVMGDNRNNSRDARYWENKYIAEDDILAKVVFKYSPRFEWMKSPEY